MEKILKIMIKVLLLTVIAVLIAMACSCGSKKKMTNRYKEETKTETEIKAETKEEHSSEKHEVKEVTREEKSDTSETDFFGEIEDPSKPATVKKEEKENITVWTFDNFKEVRTKEKNESGTSHETEQNESITKEEVKRESETNIKSGTDSKASGRETDTEVFRTNSFVGIGIGLGVILLVFLIYKYRKP